ncbi:MAG: sugar ABC transporter permease [Alkalispirochaeta sp.]
MARNAVSTFEHAQRRLSVWFVMPGFLMIFIVMGGVAIYSFDLSFRNLELLRGFSSDYVGFETYRTVLSRRETIPVIGNTLYWVSMSTILVIVLGISVGYLVSDSTNRVTRISRAVMLVPWVLPGVVVAGLWKWMYNGQNGLINKILLDIGVIEQGFPFLARPETVLPSVVLVIVWRLFPIYALVVASSIQSIEISLFEAAKMDGISPWQEFRFIILPSIKYQVLTMGVTVLIWITNNLVLVNVMTGGGPLYFSKTLPVFMYELGFRYGKLSEAAVVTVFNLIILLALSVVYLAVYRRNQRGDI